MKRVCDCGVMAVAGAIGTVLVLLVLALPAEAQAAVPGAPTNVAVTRGNQKVVVRWKAPAANGGSPITGYVVTPFQGGKALTPVKVDSAATEQTVTDLRNGASYTFKVAAVNAAGTGPVSAASPAVTPKGPGTTAWYRQKRWWAAGLVVLVAIVAVGVYLLRRRKTAAPDAA